MSANFHIFRKLSQREWTMDWVNKVVTRVVHSRISYLGDKIRIVAGHVGHKLEKLSLRGREQPHDNRALTGHFFVCISTHVDRLNPGTIIFCLIMHWPIKYGIMSFFSHSYLGTFIGLIFGFLSSSSFWIYYSLEPIHTCFGNSLSRIDANFVMGCCKMSGCELK